MRFSEFAPPASAAQNRQPQQQQKRQPAALEPTDVTRGRMRRELAKRIAQSQAQVQPTEDDLAIAFMRACQAQKNSHIPYAWYRKLLSPMVHRRWHLFVVAVWR